MAGWADLHSNVEALTIEDLRGLVEDIVSVLYKGPDGCLEAGKEWKAEDLDCVAAELYNYGVLPQSWGGVVTKGSRAPSLPWGAP